MLARAAILPFVAAEQLEQRRSSGHELPCRVAGEVRRALEAQRAQDLRADGVQAQQFALLSGLARGRALAALLGHRGPRRRARALTLRSQYT